MKNHKYKRAVIGITAALIFSIGALPVMADTISAAAGTFSSVVTSDVTFLGGLDLEAQIITTVEQDQRSPYAKTGIAAVEEYLDIRALPSEEAEIVGRLYADSGCDIQEISDGWAHIISGECEGYVEAKYLLTGTDAEAYAEENEVSEIVATTQAEEIYVYADASEEAEVVGSITEEDELTVLGYSEDGLWMEVEVEEIAGYVWAASMDLRIKYEVAVSVEDIEEEIEDETSETSMTEAEGTQGSEAEATQEEAEDVSAESESSQETEVTVTEVNETVWAKLNVAIRSIASTDGEKLGTLSGGCSITRTGKLDNGWSRVEYNGTEAYIKSEYLTTVEPVVEETSVTVYATAGVNVRSTASTSGEILGTLTVGTSITQLSVSDGWSKVDYNGKTGYVKSTYLSTTAPEIKETVYATTTVNIRDAASTDGSVIGQLSKGSSIVRTSEADGWSKVSYDGKTGYIKSTYLTTTKPTTTTTTSTSSSSVTVESVSETVYTTAGVNIRSEASVDSDKLGTVSSGTSLTRTGKLSNGWSQVEYNGKTGYVKSTYLTTTKPTSSSSSSSSSSLGEQIAAFALKYVGYPYVYGGNSLTTGVDCSGFTQQVYLHFGISIPRRASIQATAGTAVSISDLQPGDLVFYTSGGSSVGHVAIYIGNNQVVHASSVKTGIKISSLYYKTPTCARRFI